MAGTFMKNRIGAVSRYSKEDNEPGVGEPGEGELIALQSQEAIEEVMALDGDVTALQADGDELATVYGEVLPEVHEVLDSAQEAGGITVEAVSLLAIIGNLTGTDLSTTVATESFNGQGRSQQATRVALEAVTDRLGNWWQALKRWLKKMWKKVKDWWNKTFSGAASLKAAAEAMKKRAQGSTSKVIKNENVSFSGATLVMNKDGKVIPADVKAGFKLFADKMDGVVLKYPKDVADAGKKFVDKIADLDFEKTAAGTESTTAIANAQVEFDTVVSTMLVQIGVVPDQKPSGSLGINAMFDKNVGQGGKVSVSAPFPGNRVIYSISEGGEQRVGLAAAGKKEPEGDIEGKALGISDITAICESIINGCDSIVRSNSSINNSSKVEDDLDKCGDRVERVLAQTEKATDEAHKSTTRFTRAAKGIAEALVEPHRSFVAHFMGSSSAVLRYATASLATAN